MSKTKVKKGKLVEVLPGVYVEWRKLLAWAGPYVWTVLHSLGLV